MKIRLICHRPLGAIVRAFPFAAHLAKAGHQVFIECPAGSASILKLIDYAKWWNPGDTWQASASTEEIQSVVLHIQGAQAHTYRSSNPPKRWADYLIDQWPKLFKGMKREIVFTHLPEIEEVRKKYRLPEDYDLVCPCPSQEGPTPIYFWVLETWLAQLCKNPGQCYMLAGQGWRPNRLHVCVDDLSELAALIAGAKIFASVSAGPAVIASGLIDGRPLRGQWDYVAPLNPRERFQDDIQGKNQVRWEMSLAGSAPLIIPLRSKS